VLEATFLESKPPVSAHPRCAGSRYLPKATISPWLPLAVMGVTELNAGESRQICHIADLTTADVDALSKCTAGVSIQIARQRDHPISICCFVS